jgi:DNA-binding XRE family transcriptional regulator
MPVSLAKPSFRNVSVRPIAIVIALVASLMPGAYTPGMLDSGRLTAIRRKLGLTQEQMARLLGVSFVSVNRWEGGHSSPTGPTLDLYLAIDAAVRTGHAPETIRQAANSERGAFLYALFRMAYARPRGRSR